jgi:glycogen debranching enzyme
VGPSGGQGRDGVLRADLHRPTDYGTVDATPLWICLLHDAWRWGLPAADIEPLLPRD